MPKIKKSRLFTRRNKMLAYKRVYRLENGKLVQNTENKIEYTDKKGIKRTITNPSLRDFARVGLYPVCYNNDLPTYDITTETLEEKIKLENGCYIVSYKIVPIKSEEEVSTNEENIL